MNINDPTKSDLFDKHRSLAGVFFDPYVVFSPNGVILEYNPQFFAFLQDGNLSVIGENIFDLLHFELTGKNLSISEMIGTNQVRMDDIHCRVNPKFLKHNKTIVTTVVTSSLPIFDEKQNNEPVCYFMLIRDVTADAHLQSNYFSTSSKSITDPLTGQRNRGYLDQYFSNHYDLMLRQISEKDSSHHVSIILTDLDHFKKINDTYGHQAGDLVLKNAAAVFDSLIRKTDVVCRYGGEEFVFVLIGASIDQAALIAEKLRKNIEETVFKYGETIIPVRSSFGVTELVPSDLDPSIAIKRADEALYRAKRSGRNCVVALRYEETLQSTETKTENNVNEDKKAS